MNTGNYIQLSGRLTADVTPNEGKTFARFTLAKNFTKDNKNARFFRCVIFKKEFDDNQQTIPSVEEPSEEPIFVPPALSIASLIVSYEPNISNTSR